MKTILVATLLFILSVLNFSNVVHATFTDEYDNLLGGSLILQGKILYTDFFSNHGSIAYFTAALIEIFSVKDLFRFRVIYQLLLNSVQVVLIYYIFKKYGFKESYLVSIFFIMTAMSVNFFSGHLLVADNLAGIFLMLAYILVFYNLYKQNVPSIGFIFIASLFSFLALFTAYTYIFVVVTLYLFLFSKKNIVLPRVWLVISVPYVLGGLYLLATSSWSDFYFQTVTFNRQYYVYGEAAQVKNVFDLAYLLFVKSLIKYKDLILAFKQFNLQFPFVPALLLSNTVLWLYLFLTRRIKLLVFSIFCVVYTNARNEPFSPGIIDFHSSSYIFLSLFNGYFVLFHAFDIFKTKVNLFAKAVFGCVLVLLAVYLISYSHFFYIRWWNIMQDKLASVGPLYQIHPVSYYLDRLIEGRGYYLIGPYDPESNFYSQLTSTSKYYYLMPAMEKVPWIMQELIDDVNKHKPKVIVYNTELNILGSEPGKDFIHFLRKDYINLEDAKSKLLFKYRPVLKFVATFNYDLERHFFIRKDNLNEVLQKLIDLHYIEILI